METDKKVVVFGEILYDQFVEEGNPQPIATVLGGAPLNVAYHLKRNFGIPCDVISSVGGLSWDGLGGASLREIREAGISTTLIQKCEHKQTGLVYVQTGNGTHSFEILQDRAFDYIEPSSAAIESARQADYIYFGTLAQRNSVSRVTLMTLLDEGSQATRFCDINLRKDCYTSDIVTNSIRLANMVKLNDHEVYEVLKMYQPNIQTDTLTPGEAAKALLDQICTGSDRKELIVTLGERGALAFDLSGTPHYHQGFAISPGQDADTVGSGDAFAAGYLKCRIEGLPVYNALREGNRAGALVACQRGALCQILESDTLVERPLTPNDSQLIIVPGITL